MHGWCLVQVKCKCKWDQTSEWIFSLHSTKVCTCCRQGVQGGQLLQNQVHAPVSLQGAGQTVLLLLLQTLRAQLQELLLSVIQLSMYRYFAAFRSNDFHRFSQHMTSLNKIFISFHTQVPVKTIRQGARRLVTHGLALMCLKYNLLSRGQEVFQIICINVSEKSEFLHLNFKMMFKCV